MNEKDQQLISRGLDGALSQTEREKLDQLLATDAEAQAYHKTCDKIGDQLRTAPPHLPDATVAWQDIHRAIRLHEADREAAQEVPLLGRLRWAGALAGVVIIGLLGASAWSLFNPPQSKLAAREHEPMDRVEWVVAEIPGATTMIYTDTETDLTVIWMDVAQGSSPRDS